MAELVATMVVGPLLSIVKDKASSYLLDQYKVMEGMEEQHRVLKRKLRAILDVINDAEQEASHRDGAKAWLEEVKRVAYQANEIFDEFKYEALRREAKKNGHYSKLGFDVIKLFLTHNRIAFREKMGKKLCRVLQAIEVLVTEMNAFGFKYQRQVPASKQWRQTDHVIFDPKKIISRSRDQDRRNIVDTLLGQASNADLTVVPIVGVGGLGKTTLAQLIYNEPEIQKHYELLLWVCVSDSFDVDSLAKSIAELLPKKSIAESASRKSPLDVVQDALRGHRYLLVLDDVWNREPDKWEKLKSCLAHGAKGSAVLTTTRDEGVTKIMGTVNAYNLAALGDNFIKEIIETKAFSLQKEEERPSVLVNMVGQFVKRCRGSPLAAASLGSVLRTKTSKEEWKAVLSRSSICTEESGILPILKLSYNDLSSQMKQCFAFCAMFPKDYEIDVDKLIQLWMAHGFIDDEKEVSPETIGKRIFNELASRSFFVDVKQAKATSDNEWSSYSKHTCKIHDLMHDVALSTMEKECALMPEQPSQVEWLPDTARHIFLSCEKPETVLNDSLLTRSPAFQTLLCDNDMREPLQQLSKYSSLMALQLCTRRRSFPLKSKHLHHLRYLDLSSSRIKALPEDISILYNLQTLNVSGCEELSELPRQIKYMTALRHLYTHGCPRIRSMPGGLGKLLSLQTLTCFVAGPSGSGCSDVGELHQLNLGGLLELLQLENVTEEAAKTANIGKKEELRELKLEWTVGCEDDARVLEVLKPHDELQVVRIESYGGTTFPTWMSMLRNVVEIHLSGCSKLQWLFSCDTSFSFPNLKEFTLRGLQSLERWWELSHQEQGKEVIFPLLDNLSINGCPKLTKLPEATLLGESYGTMARSAFPELKELYLCGLDSFERWEAIEGNQSGYIIFPRLEKLEISSCRVLTAFPEAQPGGDYGMARSAFPALKILSLKKLQNFESSDAVDGSQREDAMFPQLQELYIEGCGKMKVSSGQQKVSPKLAMLHTEGIKEEMFLLVARHMTSLTHLKLQSSGETETTLLAADHSLKLVVDVTEKGNHNDFPLKDMELRGFKSGVAAELCAHFVQLQHLYFTECDALVHWPEKEFQSLVSLRRLIIWHCTKLVGYGPQASAAEPSTTPEPSSELLPRLESLLIYGCPSMVEVLKLPASLRELTISNCTKLTSIYSRRLQQGQSASLTLQGPSPVYSEVSSSSANARTEHFLFPYLEEITINSCDSLTGVLYFPPSLVHLGINDCKTLSSLPNGPQAYSSLQSLIITKCPSLKRLPTCLQQRLSSLQYKYLDARFQGEATKPQAGDLTGPWITVYSELCSSGIDCEAGRLLVRTVSAIRIYRKSEAHATSEGPEGVWTARASQSAYPGSVSPSATGYGWWPTASSLGSARCRWPDGHWKKAEGPDCRHGHRANDGAHHQFSCCLDWMVRAAVAQIQGIPRADQAAKAMTTEPPS
ncbi:putative disease resistance protein RGA4 [Lolium rigidum]|uniref:putative disease resistance protein RGA4 n=1 Tax=Lolium rigidum TaxID=89674 RepID=UPI001F5D1DD1|nr:putative disease resistance protein RGA4 [Lolium rigidum]